MIESAIEDLKKRNNEKKKYLEAYCYNLQELLPQINEVLDYIPGLLMNKNASGHQIKSINSGYLSYIWTHYIKIAKGLEITNEKYGWYKKRSSWSACFNIEGLEKIDRDDTIAIVYGDSPRKVLFIYNITKNRIYKIGQNRPDYVQDIASFLYSFNSKEKIELALAEAIRGLV